MQGQSYLKKWFGQKKSLTDEVIEVFDRVTQLKKLGHNEDDNYDYLRIVDLCDAFKGELFERGILFIATDRDRSFEQISDKGGKFIERCTVLTDFAALRGKERVELGSSLGSAQDHSDKALAIAQTAAFKAFLKRSSMTYGQEDDPEKPRESLTPREAAGVASYQHRAWSAAVRDCGVSKATISEELSKIAGCAVDCEDVPKLPREQFETAMKWLLNHRDLTSEWSRAVDELKAKKGGPQPVVSIAEAERPEEITGY